MKFWSEPKPYSGQDVQDPLAFEEEVEDHEEVVACQECWMWRRDPGSVERPYVGTCHLRGDVERVDPETGMIVWPKTIATDFCDDFSESRDVE